MPRNGQWTRCAKCQLSRNFSSRSAVGVGLNQQDGLPLMQWRRRLLTGVNVVANRAGLHVLSHAEYNYVVNMFLPRNGEGHPMPKAAREYLRTDHPHLDDLRTRYRNHPAAEHSHC